MVFIIFLWNTFVRIVSFSFFILLECVVFFFIYKYLLGVSFILANFLAFIFFIWLIVEVILGIVVGSSVNIIKYILGRFL